MKSILPLHIGGDPGKLLLEIQAAKTQLKAQGSPRPPNPPRSLIAQSGSRKVILTWLPPPDDFGITGWRIYKGTENNLVMRISDRSTMQASIPCNAGATPPVSIFFISSVNGLAESIRVSVKGAALADAAAQVDPPPPPITWNWKFPPPELP